MHVIQKPPLAALLMLALAGLGSAAHAVEFEEKLKAPAMKNVGELRSQGQIFATKFMEIRAATPTQLIANASLARQQFDLTWQMQRAIDERKPLEDLAELGVISRGDGSYRIDKSAHPEWSELPVIMLALLTGDNLDGTVSSLVQRGFRPQDVETLKDYVATHNARAAPAAAGPSLALGFARAVGKYDKLKRPVPDALVHSFFYQRARVTNEANRAWSEGLLKRLDAQRGRILLSYSMEARTETVWLPEDIAAGIAETLALARQPDFEQRVLDEAKGVAP